jgi:hypothetical protein
MAKKQLDDATKKRLRAGRMLLAGKRPAEVALAVGVARQAVYTCSWMLVSTLILYRAVEQAGGANPYRVRHAEDATICFGMRRRGCREVEHDRDAEQSADDATQGLAVGSVSALLPQLSRQRERAKVGEAPMETNSMVLARCRPRGLSWSYRNGGSEPV